jgi:CheY-like chemotaxis protein
MSQKTILIIDDDPDVRLSFNVRLKANHYNVVFAGDGVAAISEARKHTPDYPGPRIAGRGWLQRAGEIEIQPHFVVYSGHCCLRARPERKQRARAQSRCESVPAEAGGQRPDPVCDPTSSGRKGRKLIDRVQRGVNLGLQVARFNLIVADLMRVSCTKDGACAVRKYKISTVVN